MKIYSAIPFNDMQFQMFIMDEMANKYEERYDDVIRMTLGKSELPVCEPILNAMREALQSFEKSSLVFPTGLPLLKDCIARDFRVRYGADIKPENIIINVGTSSVFRNLFQLLATSEDEILLPDPYYPLYKICAMLIGAKINYYRIDPENLKLDIESFKNALTDKTKIVVINSPGNPLGNILTLEELFTIDSLINGKATIISDEIYWNMCFDEEYPSFYKLNNVKSQFIVTDSFSKGYRMYSRRVGYAIVPDELVLPLTVVQHHTLLTVDPISQFGAIEAINHPEELKYLSSLYKARRNFTLRRFNTIPLVKAIPAKGSFYITLDCRDYLNKYNISNDLSLAQQIMESTHVATVPGSDFGLPGTLRLSYSTNLFEQGIDRLIAFFNRIEKTNI